MRSAVHTWLPVLACVAVIGVLARTSLGDGLEGAILIAGAVLALLLLDAVVRRGSRRR